MDKTLRYFLAVILLAGSCFGQQILAPIFQKPPSAATFPTTSVLDTFTRANENPLSDGGNWTCPFVAGSSLKIVTNQAVGSGTADSGCDWTASTFGPETEVYVTVPTLPSTSDSAILFARWSGGSSGSGYEILYCNGGGCDCGSSGICIARLNAGVPTVIGSVNATTLSAGDSFGALFKGAVISVFKKTSGVWSLVFSQTDGSPITSSGNIGLLLEGTGTGAFTNFGGGTGTE